MISKLKVVIECEQILYYNKVLAKIHFTKRINVRAIKKRDLVLNTSVLTATVVSDIKIINNKNGNPFCRFTILVDHQKFNCLIPGKKAVNFLYKIPLDTDVTIQYTINNRNQLVVQKFKVSKAPTSFNHSLSIKEERCFIRKFCFKYLDKLHQLMW